jgi:hypothetical protein
VSDATKSGNTVASALGLGSDVVGFDSVSFTLKVERFGTGSGLMQSGRIRLGESVTVQLNVPYGWATVRGSLPKHFGGSNVKALPVGWFQGACSSLVDEIVEAGWLVPRGECPWGGRLHRLDVAFDFHCSDRAALLMGAFRDLRFRRDEKPALYGRPVESLLVLRRTRRGRYRINHRAYDKGIEAGVEGLDQLRVEYPMLTRRLEKAGMRSVDGPVESAAAEAWAALSRYGWWEVL